MNQHKIKKLLFSPILTLPLALLAGPFFMWSKNWHMYTRDELGLSLVVLVGCAVLLGVLGWLLPKFTTKFHIDTVFMALAQRSRVVIDFMALILKSRVGTALIALGLGVLVVEGIYIFFYTIFHNLVHSWQMRLFIKMQSTAIVAFIIYIGIRFRAFGFFFRRKDYLITDFFLCIAAVEILFFFLNIPITTAIHTRWGIIALHSCALILCSLIVYRLGLGFLNIFLLICLCLFTITATSDIVTDELSARNALIERTEPYTTLTEKPNIYMFYMESTNGFDELEKTFHMNTAPFQDFLQDNGFRIYPGTFSDGSYTVMTMFIVDTMQRYKLRLRGIADAGRKLRSVFAGGKDNILLATVKANGYHTVQLTMNNPYFFIHAKGNLDESDVNITPTNLRPLKDLNPALPIKLPHRKVKAKFFGTLPERVHQAMMESLEKKQPLLLIFKGGADHTPPDGTYDFRQRFEWTASGFYQNLLKQGFQEAEIIISDILKYDPNSVIIMMGDHGPWRLRGIGSRARIRDLSDLARILAAEGESLESLAKDIYDILLAIRMPDGPRDISYGYPISPVNLFRHVFAGINHDPSLLDDRVPQQSSPFGLDIVLVKEGIVQQPEDKETE